MLTEEKLANNQSSADPGHGSPGDDEGQSAARGPPASRYPLSRASGSGRSEGVSARSRQTKRSNPAVSTLHPCVSFRLYTTLDRAPRMRLSSKFRGVAGHVGAAERR